MRARFRHLHDSWATPPSRTGSVLVEMALTLPLLLLLLGSIIDLGWVFSRQLILIHAAREGARQATLGLSAADVSNCIISTAGAAALPLASGDCSVITVNDVTTVRISKPVPVFFGVMGHSVTLQATISMRKETT